MERRWAKVAWASAPPFNHCLWTVEGCSAEQVWVEALEHCDQEARVKSQSHILSSQVVDDMRFHRSYVDQEQPMWFVDCSQKEETSSHGEHKNVGNVHVSYQWSVESSVPCLTAAESNAV